MNDNDVSEHSLLLRSRGGFKALFPFSSDVERSRVHRNLQNRNLHFVVFDTPTHRVVLRRAALSFWQFLFDPAFNQIERPSHAMVGAVEDTANERDQPLRFWLVDGGAPLTFGMDYDLPSEAAFSTPRLSRWACYSQISKFTTGMTSC